MRCSNCAVENDGGSNFCRKCAYPLSGTKPESIAFGSSQLDFDGDATPKNFGQSSSSNQFSASPTYYAGVQASRGMRLLGLILDWFLVGITLGIGWFIWFLLIARHGKTPAKQILKTRLVTDSGANAGTWRTFWHYYLPNIIAWVLAPFTFLGLFSLPYVFALVFAILETLAWLVPLVDSLFIFLPKRKRLIDYLLGTRVIRD